MIHVTGQLRVLTPDLKAVPPANLQQPFILHREMAAHCRVEGVTSLPGILDLLGVGVNYGPPGFVVTQYAQECSVDLLIAGFLPGANIIMRTDGIEMRRYLGTCVSGGLVLSYFQYDFAPCVSGDIAMFEAAGFTVIPLIEYTTAPFALQYLSNAQAF